MEAIVLMPMVEGDIADSRTEIHASNMVVDAHGRVEMPVEDSPLARVRVEHVVAVVSNTASVEEWGQKAFFDGQAHLGSLQVVFVATQTEEAFQEAEEGSLVIEVEH